MDNNLIVPFVKLPVSDEALLNGGADADKNAIDLLHGMSVSLDKAFAAVPEHRIDTLNWRDSFPYAPDVRFRIFHNGKTLFLQYDVAEKYTAALEAVDGNEVYKDSCVEFFMRVDGEQSYYNFEWNAAGTMYMTYRPGRQSSEPAPKEILRSVIRESTIGPAPVALYAAPSDDLENNSSEEQRCETECRGTLGNNSSEKQRCETECCGTLGNADFTENGSVPADGNGMNGNKWRLRIAIPVEALWHSGLNSFPGLKATANFFKCGDGLPIPHYLTWAPVHTAAPDYHRPEFFAPVEFSAE